MFLRPFIFTLPILGLVLVLALNCTVDQEVLATFKEPELISFVVDDGLDHGIVSYKADGSGNYQTDRVQVTITQGPVDQVEIFYTTGAGLPYVSQVFEQISSDPQVFTVETEVTPNPTTWFIGARSTELNASTQYGTVLDPLTTQKYLNKEEANQTIRDQLLTLRSRGEYATLFPVSGDNVYAYPMVLPSGNTLDVELDHYVDFFANNVQHERYGIEYSERLDENLEPIRGVDTSTYEILEQQSAQNMGYVIISSANVDALQETLLNPDFFPTTDRVFLESIHY